MITPTSFTDRKILLIQVEHSGLYFHFQQLMTRLHQSREPNRYQKRCMFFDVYMGVKYTSQEINAAFVKQAADCRNNILPQK